MKIKQNPIVVLGAGLGGLTVASELAENGRALTIVESNPCVGGLARSVGKNGFTFDLGGHRLYSNKKWVISKVEDILGHELRLVRRKSRILLAGKYWDYPPRPLSAIPSLGFREGMKILTSYVSSAARLNHASQNNASFEHWAVSRFGSRMYESFFRPYTEKACGLPCSEISAEWGMGRVGIRNLLEAARKAVLKRGNLPRTYASQFYYPEKGIGTIATKMAQRITQGNGRILLGCEVEEVRWDQEAIESVLINNGSSRVELAADQFISTIPITSLVSLMRPGITPAVLEAAANLKYRALVCILLIVNAESVTNDSWIYFPDKDIIFARVHEPKNWSEKLVEKGKTSLCVEILCDQDDGIWRATNELLTEKVISLLSRLQILNEDKVTFSFVERIPNAYPVFKLGHQNHLAKLLDYLSRFKNLHLLGRTGMFKYWSMDQVIEEGVLKAQDLMYGD
ncbi:MAG: FAD-dependent oxidoreductase [Dehalococcoidia bacterium]|nr:FAD-dependent oxidoreductase [Dehalococcoidia bacterium]